MDTQTTTNSDELSKKIDVLEKELISTPLVGRRSVYWILGFLGFPLIVFTLLFCFRPSFILTQKKEGDVRDQKKLVRWTLVFTLVVYGAIYFYACYNSDSPESFSPEILKS